GQQVDVVGQVLPGAGHARHHRLAAQPPVGADLAGHPGDLGGQRAELLDHGVQRVLELQDLAAHVDRDLLRQIPVGDSVRDLGDAAHLAVQIGGHQVDVVGQVLPGAGHAGDLRLAAQPALAADLARHAGDLAGEAVELVDHGVQRLLQLKDLAADVDGDLPRQ